MTVSPAARLEPFLLSGVVVECPSADTAVQVWRLTFRCEVPTRDVDNRQCAYPTAPAEWHVGGGLVLRPVPGGALLDVGGAKPGHWIVRVPS